MGEELEWPGRASPTSCLAVPRDAAVRGKRLGSLLFPVCLPRGNGSFTDTFYIIWILFSVFGGIFIMVTKERFSSTGGAGLYRGSNSSSSDIFARGFVRAESFFCHFSFFWYWKTSLTNRSVESVGSELRWWGFFPQLITQANPFGSHSCGLGLARAWVGCSFVWTVVLLGKAASSSVLFVPLLLTAGFSLGFPCYVGLSVYVAIKSLSKLF